MQQTREHFLKAYDGTVDDIFDLCFSQIQNKDVAQYLTRTIFRQAWDSVVAYGIESISAMKRLIFRTAKTHVKNFNVGRNKQLAYYDKLWNLTLSQ